MSELRRIWLLEMGKWEIILQSLTFVYSSETEALTAFHSTVFFSRSSYSKWSWEYRDCEPHQRNGNGNYYCLIILKKISLQRKGRNV